MKWWHKLIDTQFNKIKFKELTKIVVIFYLIADVFVLLIAIYNIYSGVKTSSELICEQENKFIFMIGLVSLIPFITFLLLTLSILSLDFVFKKNFDEITVDFLALLGIYVIFYFINFPFFAYIYDSAKSAYCH